MGRLASWIGITRALIVDFRHHLHSITSRQQVALSTASTAGPKRVASRRCRPNLGAHVIDSPWCCAHWHAHPMVAPWRRRALLRASFLPASASTTTAVPITRGSCRAAATTASTAFLESCRAIIFAVWTSSRSTVVDPTAIPHCTRGPCDRHNPSDS